MDLAEVKDVASDSLCVATAADAQVVAEDPFNLFAVEETDEEEGSSSSSGEAPMPYAAGSAAFAASQRRQGHRRLGHGAGASAEFDGRSMPPCRDRGH